MKNNRDAAIEMLAKQYPNGLPPKVEYAKDPDAPVRFRMLIKKFSSWPRIVKMVKTHLDNSTVEEVVEKPVIAPAQKPVKVEAKPPETKGK